MRYAMVIDLGKCVGCGACTAACLMENGYKGTKPEEPSLLYSLLSKFLPLRLGKGRPLKELIEEAVEERRPELLELFEPRTKVVKVERGKFPNVEVVLWHKICQHCDDAPCARVCPTNATYVTEEGVVMLDKEKCILCGACIAACPYGARSVDPTSMTVDKCTFCYHRVKRGLLPACVETCPTGARIFGDLDDPESEVARLSAQGVTGTPEGPKGEEKGKVFYLLR